MQSLSMFFLQDLHKVEAKLQEKQLKEKEEEERQRRIAAKLKDKVRVLLLTSSHMVSENDLQQNI